MLQDNTRCGEWVKFDTLIYVHGKLAFVGHHSGSKSYAFSIGPNRWVRAKMAGVYLQLRSCLLEMEEPVLGRKSCDEYEIQNKSAHTMVLISHLRMHICF